MLRWLPIDCATLGVRYRHLSSVQKLQIFFNAPFTKYFAHFVGSLQLGAYVIFLNTGHTYALSPLVHLRYTVRHEVVLLLRRRNRVARVGGVHCYRRDHTGAGECMMKTWRTLA